MLERWNQHVYDAGCKQGRGCRHFWGAIRKYGKEAFIHEVVRTFDNLSEASIAEKALIRRWKLRDSRLGFNLARGGQHVSSSIRKSPWDRPEYRAKCVAAAKKRWERPAFRAACTAAARAKWLEPGYREKISAIFKGIPLSLEHRMKISAANRGKSIKLETREKISLSQKGKRKNPDSIAKSAASRKGTKLTDEHKAKIGAAKKGKKLSPNHVKKIIERNKNRPKKTHCKWNHSLHDAYIVKGKRYCRPCQLRRSSTYRSKA